MIVNINQCASTYDETLNVLKFSAVAQKVMLPLGFYSFCTLVHKDIIQIIIHVYNLSNYSATSHNMVQIKKTGKKTAILRFYYWRFYFLSLVRVQVVVLYTRPLPIMPQRSGSDSSFINNAERKSLPGSRRSSLIGWESSLEDVQVRRRRGHSTSFS